MVSFSNFASQQFWILYFLYCAQWCYQLFGGLFQSIPLFSTNSSKDLQGDIHCWNCLSGCFADLLIWIHCDENIHLDSRSVVLPFGVSVEISIYFHIYHSLSSFVCQMQYNLWQIGTFWNKEGKSGVETKTQAKTQAIQELFNQS